MLLVIAGEHTMLTKDLSNELVTATSAVAHDELKGIAGGAGVFIAHGAAAGKIYYSGDAINWTVIAALAGVTCYGVKYTNKKFFALGWKNNGVEDHVAIFVSDDGVTWVDCSPAVGTTADPGYCRDIEYFNGTYVAVSSAGVYTSTDLAIWVYAAMAFVCTKVVTDNVNVYVGGDTKVSWSCDAASWNDVAFAVAGVVAVMVCCVDKILVAYGSYVKSSSDRGLTWDNEMMDLVDTWISGSYAEYVNKYGDTVKVIFFVGSTFKTMEYDIAGGYFTGGSWTMPWIAYGACVLNTEENADEAVLYAGLGVVALIGTVEALANDALTGFTGALSVAAKAIVASKIPASVNDYVNCILGIRVGMVRMSSILGVVAPDAYPATPPDLYNKTQVAYRYLKYLERFNETYAAVPDPTDAYLLTVIEACAGDVAKKFGLADVYSQRLKTLYELWLANLML